VHGRPVLRDRHREHRVREPVRERRPRERLRPGRRGPLADADRQHAGREQQHVTALDRRRVGAVRAAGGAEARVVGVDQVEQRGLPVARGHRERRDRHPVANPHRRVAREQQVWQRVDDEVVRVVHLPHERRTLGGRQLLERHAGHQHVRERRVVHRGQMRAERVRELVPDPPPVDGRLRRGRVRTLVGQRGDQCVGEQQHLDVARPERLGERVVLLLRAVDPGDAVEEQLVVVARGQPLELGARPVEQDRAQRPDLAVHPRHRLLVHGQVRCCLSGHPPSVISR
jgi:hypothetical protein